MALPLGVVKGRVTVFEVVLVLRVVNGSVMDPVSSIKTGGVKGSVIESEPEVVNGSVIESVTEVVLLAMQT